MIKLGKIFQDRMVLQRRKQIKIWGESDCTQKVAVWLQMKRVTDPCEVCGEFVLSIPPQEAAEDVKLEIRGEQDSLTFNHVDIGEVWIAGGQSNMEFLLKYAEDGEQEMKAADDTHFRYYEVGKYAFDGAEEEEGMDNGWDRWLWFQPNEAAEFSAVSAYFGRKLRQKYGIPVGIVGCNLGGTSALTWISEEYIEKDSKLRNYLEEYRDIVSRMDLEEYPKKRREAKELLNIPQMKELSDLLLKGPLSAEDMEKYAPYIQTLSGLVVETGPQSQFRPCGLYHSMVEKIKGYSCCGVIWYQGESDDDKAEVYDRLFSALIHCWRGTWKEEIPFIFAQLAPFGRWMISEGNRYPIIRERQSRVAKTVPGVFMVSTMDVGAEGDIHPKRKRPVGERMALLAIGKVYGENILCESPEESDIIVEGQRIEIEFAHAGEGLYVTGDTVSALEIEVDGENLKNYGFKIDQDKLIIMDPKIDIEKRINIAFAYTGYCEVNLYNSAGLPAFPFRWANALQIE